MEITFKSKNEKQIEAAQYWIDDTTEELLYGGAKGGGKSYLGAALIFGDALIYDGTHYFIARKELIDLRKFTIPTIEEVFRNWGLDIQQYAKFNGQDNVYDIYSGGRPTGSKVFLIACKDIPSDPLFERFGSMQMTRGWLEEGGEIPEDAKANLWLSIGRWQNKEYGLKKKLLITANPKKGWMKRDFIDPWKKAALPKTRKFVQAFATDNVYLPKDYLDTLKNERDKVRRQRLWEGNWDYDEDQDALTTYDAISDAFSNAIIKDGQKYMTVDVARKGEDTTVFALWSGLELYKVEQFNKQATDVTEQRIRDVAAVEQIPYSNILVDEDGIGGGVVDHLQGVKGFTANSVPMPTGQQIRERQSKVDHHLVPKTIYGNLKAQCGWKAAELLNEHGMAFKVPEYRDTIIEELTAVLRDKDPTSEGKKYLRPKEEAKIEIARSPDVGDTILMRAYFELRKDASAEDPKLNRVMEVQLNNMKRNEVKAKQTSTR